MTKRHALWICTVLLAGAAASLASWWSAPAPDALPQAQGPTATQLGWKAQLQWVAGSGVRGAVDGRAADARFADPYGLAIGPHGALYIADGGDNNRIRRLLDNGSVQTVAGGQEGFGDGVDAAAEFNTPSGIAFDTAGNLYIADTGNHAIRKRTPQGVVTTLAGDGSAGFRDGAAAQARFNGPIGVAVDTQGRVYVADTYNDRIRVIAPDGQVSTLAGGALPGMADGVGDQARFDTPTDLKVDAHGVVWVADMRNDAIRRIAPDGSVSTLIGGDPADLSPLLHRPMTIALTHDGVLYVGDASGRVLQVTRAGHVVTMSGEDVMQRMSRPAGIAVDAQGAVYVSDAGGARVHRLVPATAANSNAAPVVGPAATQPLPVTQGRWPLQPQVGWHEVVGTLGEVRGNYQGLSRDHLHAGLDIRGDVGQTVYAIADAKVSSPYPTWGLGQLGEWLALDTIGYTHMRVGRTAQGTPLDPQRFHLVTDVDGKPDRMRVLRGTRFRAGDALGTLNGMAHVHLTAGANGFERNAVQLGFVGYADHVAPHIDRVSLLDSAGQALPMTSGRVHVPLGTAVQIVVEAWDQVDRNLPRRRLGLYALGYQVLDAQGVPLAGEAEPHMTIVFDRMPADPAAVLTAYAPDSGITVHGSAVTRFRYLVTNMVRDGRIGNGQWQAGALPPGDYVLRITARDYSGNEANANRDLHVRVE
ncbi:sugar lactone lactonase YvrE [Xanthomonas arboricola]|uniref:NHL repeat-containing protein n=1 Tax=Xanthomonas TaxID=338 RepID=UPI000F8ECA3E|nr:MULTISPECIES: NHL repeat-containing protein [Xanthomonas]MBB5766761.1 sugar lactone lactonase YvrE [Xanthomonas euroxanthea]NIK08431.1 sugar lactone lactonase YvrE [Xanthomonas euroxanthea]NJC37733.1 sugar lactone lactonase YvrE [Xanthomonas euroxanthea]